jgi:hypothetical protein
VGQPGAVSLNGPFRDTPHPADGTGVSRYGSRVIPWPVKREGRARRSLLLAPGVAFSTTGLLSLFDDMTVVGWSVFVLGLVLLIAFIRAERRSRRRSREAAE